MKKHTAVTRSLALSLLTLLPLIWMACAPSASTTASPTLTASQTPSAAATLAPPAALAPTPAPTIAKPSGELQIALGYLGKQVLDPTLDTSTVKFVLGVVYDWLVGYTSDGNLSKDTGLAMDWEMSPDATRYLFKLRPGVKFQNGDELTSADVKFSLEYFMRARSTASFAGTLRTVIKSVETPDPLTVVVNTKQPYPLLLWDLSGVLGLEGMVLPSKYITEKGEDFFATNPIGSGPYRVKGQLTGSWLQLEAQPNHWRVGVPKYQTIRFSLVPEESTRIAMLKTGETDIIDVSRERAKELASFPVSLKPGDSVVGLWLNQTWDGFLSNIKVREALNLAINREDIKNFIFDGQADLAGAMSYGSWALGYKPLPIYPYDPDKAKRLLTEAYPGGIELNAYSYDLAGVPELPKMMEAIASMWKKVGIDTKIIPVEYSNYRNKLIQKGLVNSLSASSVSNRPLFLSHFRVLYHSQGTTALVHDPAVDRMIEQAEKELSMDRIGVLQQQVAEYLVQNHYTVPLVETGSLYASNPKKLAKWNLGKNIYDLNLESLYKR